MGTRIKEWITRVKKRIYTLGACWTQEFKVLGDIWSKKVRVLKHIRSEFKMKESPSIVRLFMTFLQLFRCFSLSNFKYLCYKKETQHTFIDTYVLIWLGVFCGLLYWLPSWLSLWVFILHLPLCAVIVGYRLLDIYSLHLGSIFIDRLRRVDILSPRRSLILLGINYLEIILAFAIMYLATNSIGYSDGNNLITTRTEAFYFSAVTITTLGCGNMVAKSSLGMGLVVLESILGLTIIALVLHELLKK